MPAFVKRVGGAPAVRFHGSRAVLGVFLCGFGLLQAGCGTPPAPPAPVIEFRRVPPATEGGPDRVENIDGRVTGASRGQQIVLFARSGFWWVQPLASEPYTEVKADSSWSNTTHLGTEYAALLVEPGYRPPARTPELPAVGAGVVAVAIVKGAVAPPSEVKVLEFSGYDWKVRSVASERGGGGRNTYSPGNAWTAADGALHLRVSTGGEGWVCAEVSLLRSFGYGTYVFVVRDAQRLDPRAVLGFFTWDESAPDEKHREMAVEMSRSGDPSNKNAQFVIQPYYVPANVARFVAPAGLLTHTLRWEKGRAAFRTAQGRPDAPGSRSVAEHAFISGVPTPGNETVRMNLYAFGAFDAARPIESEIVVEKFEYLP